MRINLSGEWSFKKINDTKYLPATVPGSVYNDLINNNQMDDPFYRDNEDKAREQAEYDYEYTRNFTISDLNYENLHLVCEGLDTLSSIYINDVLIAETKNMHRGYSFDVSSILKIGKNEIKIIFKSPIKYIEKCHSSNPIQVLNGTIDGFTHIRKAHYMFGWDWGAQLPDLGIWRDIYIICFDKKITDFYITQIHNENSVLLDISVDTMNCDLITVEITSPTGEKYFSKGKKSKILIENPLLWWHSGFGEQHLYNVKISLGEFDEKKFKIGIRKLTINNENDEWGQKFCFNINNKDIFAMGSNYIPEDNILARMSEEKTRKLLINCVNANHNCIRVWGGGIFLPDYFYNICDELSLIVWHDFMFACGVYNFDEIEEEVKQEIIYNVKRLRHHSCIALWCGNNEIELAWTHWNWDNEYDIKYKADYIKLFEYVIPKLILEYDPNRFYWKSSPSSYGSFKEPNSENIGDKHYWSVWHGQKPFEDYKNCYFRFLSEFGFQSFPCIKTIETFTLPKDRNIFSYVMEKHQKNGTANTKILQYMSETYRYPLSLQGIIYLSQLLQAEAMRYGVEHFRRNRGRCMGTIYWQTNDCWPVASWAGIDNLGRWKALHYKSKRFFAPILLSADILGNSMINLVIINDSNKNIDAKVTWKLTKSDGKIVQNDVFYASVNSLEKSEIKTLDFSKYMINYKNKTEYVFTYQLWIDDLLISDESQLFVKPKHFNFEKPNIKVSINNKNELLISTDVFTHDIMLELIDGDAIFSDNFFSLQPSSIKIIKSNNQVSLDNLKILSLYDYSYE